MPLLVAIEGIDGSGKGTHAAHLHEALSESAVTAETLSFPRYQQTRFGTAVADFLNGRFGALHEVHPQLAATLFAGDRFESRDAILEALSQHDVLICDRYVASNVAHQAAKLHGLDRQRLIDWIVAIEFEVFQLPRPDLTILLDVPVTVAQELISLKARRAYTEKAADLHEADATYLAEVREVYRELARQDEMWVTIEGVTAAGLRPVDEIAQDVRACVEARLPRSTLK